MNDIVNKLIEAIEKGNVWVALTVVAVAIIFNLRTLFSFFEERQKARIIKLEAAIQCPQIVGSTKSHLENELAAEHFKITTGMRLEKEMRESLINLHKKSHGEISFAHFKRGLPHIFYKNKRIVVEISFIEYALFVFNLFFGIALIFSGLFLMVLPTDRSITWIELFSQIGLGFIFITTALFMLTQTFPIMSANRVKKLIQKMNSMD